jgi:hypothetical protein
MASYLPFGRPWFALQRIADLIEITVATSRQNRNFSLNGFEVEQFWLASGSSLRSSRMEARTERLASPQWLVRERMYVASVYWSEQIHHER